MGFNFGDLLTVAEGAIERDRFHSDADLKIRGELLVADKNAYINRKNKKYESELKAYEVEQDKVNKIKSLNASMPSDGKGNAHDYAVKYNMILYPNFLNLSPNEQTRFVNSTKKLIEGPNGTGTLRYDSNAEKSKAYLESEIDNLSNITSKIYADKLINARGNSFLINKITKTEQPPLSINDAEVQSEIDKEMKALNLVKEVEKLSAEEMGEGKKLTGTVYAKTETGYNYWSALSLSQQDDFAKKWDTNMKSVVWKGADNQEVLGTVVNIINSIGGNTKAFVTVDTTKQGKVLALKEPGKAIVNWIEEAFNQERTKYNVATAYNHLKNNYDGDAIGNIYHIASNAEILKTIRHSATDRDFYLEGEWLGFFKDISGAKIKPEAVTLLPLGIVPLNDRLQIIKDGKGATIQLSTADIKNLSKAYGNLFKDADSYGKILELFKEHGDLNEAMFNKYKDKPNLGMAYIAKELNQSDALITNVGQIIWLTLAATLGEEKIGSELWEIIEEAKKESASDQKIKESFKPTIIEMTDPSGELVSGIQYWSTDKKEWRQLSKKQWDSVSDAKKAEWKILYPDIYALLITLE